MAPRRDRRRAAACLDHVCPFNELERGSGRAGDVRLLGPAPVTVAAPRRLHGASQSEHSGTDDGAERSPLSLFGRQPLAARGSASPFLYLDSLCLQPAASPSSNNSHLLSFLLPRLPVGLSVQVEAEAWSGCTFSSLSCPFASFASFLFLCPFCPLPPLRRPRSCSRSLARLLLLLRRRRLSLCSCAPRPPLL